jgi:LuxR family transcriptional regulator, quorum-sensing system regulator BjaR1
VSYDPDEILGRMRDDSESDWPDRIITAMRDVRQPSDILTPREIEMLKALSHGMGSGDCGALFGIADSTARGHIYKAQRKLRAKNGTHAVALAMREGLIA